MKDYNLKNDKRRPKRNSRGLSRFVRGKTLIGDPNEEKT